MKNTTFLYILLCLSLALLSTACGPRLPQHVIFIGLDGWGSYSLDKADMPHVQKMMEEGAWTRNKRTVLPSHSATNWDAMFTGVGPEMHGFYKCCSQKPDLEPVVRNEDGLFPTIFTYLRAKEPDAEIGCIYQWNGIKYFIDSLACSYHAQATQEELCDASRNYILEKKPRFAAFIYDEPDHVGHVAGHDTPELYQKLLELDLWVGRILDAVEEAGIMEESVIIVTSDHGGIGQGHGGITMEEMLTPLVICGKDIRKGYCFDDIPVMQYDMAGILADLLGVKLPDYCAARNKRIDIRQ